MYIKILHDIKYATFLYGYCYLTSIFLSPSSSTQYRFSIILNHNFVAS